MAGESFTTTDHEKIRKWAENRGAKPSKVEGTGGDDGIGLLRFNFPGYTEEGLVEISWDEFFEEFEDKELALLYQEDTNDSEKGNFFKIVKR